jgi:hypothetical protein
VLCQLRDGIEVIVNNDSNDIDQIEHPRVQYYYQKFDDLSSNYEFVLSKSTGEYVYFLEDDDYLVGDFLNQQLDADLIVGNYYPKYETTDLFEIVSMYKDDRMNTHRFIDNLNIEHLQLSQHIYKRSLITDFVFPKDNNIRNDIKLTLHAAMRAKSIKTNSKIFYYQTIDGGDNISFPESTKSVNIIENVDFLKDYGIK